MDLTDKQIIEAMYSQAEFTRTLREQIGEVKGTKVDRKGGFVHFFGAHKNCSFEFDRVIQTLKDIERDTKTLREISFR